MAWLHPRSPRTPDPSCQCHSLLRASPGTQLKLRSDCSFGLLAPCSLILLSLVVRLKGRLVAVALGVCTRLPPQLSCLLPPSPDSRMYHQSRLSRRQFKTLECLPRVGSSKSLSPKTSEEGRLQLGLGNPEGSLTFLALPELMV
jgi:hypothetical protein